ncbi:hypothetical protein LUZ61_003484 [Rhynchospora tenuis]|uniref:J domain-containing protein n=1 Tax=Rhynchospora tenuis TaxID=198213 RepID=A0AAD5ZLC7_9POAL|nr:hypothetical protein LUZ61_003484 [Rhynchospora tenuis]
MAVSSSLPSERKHWWLTNRKVVERYIREARVLVSTHNQSDAVAALNLIDSALSLSPRFEPALELKARSLLILRRYKDIADMLQDYIPSCYKTEEDSLTGSSGSGSTLSGGGGSGDLAALGRAKLLSPGRERSAVLNGSRSFRCFSVSDLKRRVLAGISRNGDKDSMWRYLILGEACSHLGLMEDAMVLLQTARRLASAAFRRESNGLSDDSFSASSIPLPTSNPNQNSNTKSQQASQQQFEPEYTTQLLAHVKLLLRRRAAALAALEAGLHSEAVRHFSKILDSRCGVPVPFAAACLVGRAAANRAAGRLADAVSDCNRALALDPSSIPALRTRASLFEMLHALPDCLRDLDHLKLLYDSILRDGKLPGPPWRWPHQEIRLREIPMSLRALTSRIQELRSRIAAGEGSNLDYYALLGLRRGCTRSELERAHLLLSLKHKPEKAIGFADRLEIVDEYRDLDAVRDQAKMSASILYRMLQKGYLCILADVSVEEEAEKQRAKEAAQAALAKPKIVHPESSVGECNVGMTENKAKQVVSKGVTSAVSSAPPVYQGVFCRDLAVVGSLLSRAMPLKYEALSC